MVPTDRQASDEFLCLAVISGHVVDPHYASSGSSAQRCCPVGLDLVTAVTGDGDCLRANGVWVVIVHGFSLPLARVLSSSWHFGGRARCAGGGCAWMKRLLNASS